MAKRHKRNKDFTNSGSPIVGLLLAIAGIAIFLKQTGYIMLPKWELIWPSALIIVGIYQAITRRFQDSSWFVMIIVGTVFLLHTLYPELNIRKFIFPIVLVSVGVGIILNSLLRPKPSNFYTNSNNDFSILNESQMGINPESHIKITSILSGVNRKVISKDFKGGSISCFMGGAEIDFTQADIQDKAYLNIEQAMGGITLKLPTNWKIESHIGVIMGGIDDHRYINNYEDQSSTKTLVLSGNIIMAGIEINS